MKTTLTLMLGLLSVGCGSNPQAESSYSQLIAERQQEAQRIRSLLDSDYARSLEEKGGVRYRFGGEGGIRTPVTLLG
jgi:hypothetical protein